MPAANNTVRIDRYVEKVCVSIPFRAGIVSEQQHYRQEPYKCTLHFPPGNNAESARICGPVCIWPPAGPANKIENRPCTQRPSRIPKKDVPSDRDRRLGIPILLPVPFKFKLLRLSDVLVTQ